MTDFTMLVCITMFNKPLSRYTKSSMMSQRLAEELNRTIQREHDLFAFTSDVAPVLILLDRRDDPVTPLLHQWTYQAMVSLFCLLLKSTSPGEGEEEMVE